MSATDSHASRTSTTQGLPPSEIHAAIKRLAGLITARHKSTDRLFLLGIANGGITLAHRLTKMVPESRAGTLDISFHRDDIGRHPIPKEFAPTHIPGDVNNATIVLIDDVLQSGRTINAALNEVFDHGRPARVELAVLVDRGGHLLPICADYAGLMLAATDDEKVVIRLDAEDPTKDSLAIIATAAPKNTAKKAKTTKGKKR